MKYSRRWQIILGFLGAFVLLSLPFQAVRADLMVQPPCLYNPSPDSLFCDDSYTPDQARAYWADKASEKKIRQQKVTLYEVIGVLELLAIVGAVYELRRIRRSHG